MIWTLFACMVLKLFFKLRSILDIKSTWCIERRLNITNRRACGTDATMENEQCTSETGKSITADYALWIFWKVILRYLRRSQFKRVCGIEFVVMLQTSRSHFWFVKIQNILCFFILVCHNSIMNILLLWVYELTIRTTVRSYHTLTMD